jgi:hypothetical protein
MAGDERRAAIHGFPCESRHAGFNMLHGQIVMPPHPLLHHDSTALSECKSFKMRMAHSFYRQNVPVLGSPFDKNSQNMQESHNHNANFLDKDI